LQCRGPSCMASVPTKPLLAENKATTTKAYASLLFPIDGSARHKKSGKKIRRVSMRMTSQRLGLRWGTSAGTERRRRPTQSKTLKHAMSSVTNLSAGHRGESDNAVRWKGGCVLMRGKRMHDARHEPVVQVFVAAAHFSQHAGEKSQRDAKVACNGDRRGEQRAAQQLSNQAHALPQRQVAVVGINGAAGHAACDSTSAVQQIRLVVFSCRSSVV
jgi:hypothetical protein